MRDYCILYILFKCLWRYSVHAFALNVAVTSDMLLLLLLLLSFLFCVIFCPTLINKDISYALYSTAQYQYSIGHSGLYVEHRCPLLQLRGTSSSAPKRHY